VAARYSTTKGALIAFTRHLAGELGPYGITVNGLAPGRIDTPLLRPSRMTQTPQWSTSRRCAVSVPPMKWPQCARS
jgi:Dehydrogenases with different specificities (related to short-chain alcohol dehydrogenases)